MWQELASIDWGALGPVFAIFGMVFFLLAGKIIDSRTQRDTQYNRRIDDERRSVQEDYHRCQEDMRILQEQMSQVMRDLSHKESEITILSIKLENCEKHCENLQRILDE